MEQIAYRITNKTLKEEKYWKQVGIAEIGPSRLGQKTNEGSRGKTSGPEVRIMNIHTLDRYLHACLNRASIIYYYYYYYYHKCKI